MHVSAYSPKTSNFPKATLNTEGLLLLTHWQMSDLASAKQQNWIVIKSMWSPNTGLAHSSTAAAQWRKVLS